MGTHVAEHDEQKWRRAGVGSSPKPKHAQPERVVGHAAVLAQEKQLRMLAERCGQAGAARSLPYFLSDPHFGGKRPHLLLYRSGPQGVLEAAVLLYEYTVLGLPTGLFLSPDMEGERCVIAPAGERESYAWRAAEAVLLRGGGRLLLLAVQDANFAIRADKDGRFASLATLQREFQNQLPLRSTLDETLAQFGHRTRRNLRAAKRHAVMREGISFVPEVRMSEEEFLTMSLASAYAVREEVARWRFQFARENGLFAGLRGRDGAWLALLGGRREADATVIDWQVNLRDLSHLSLGLTLRAFLIEAEVARGARFLRFEGGTSHSMRNGFAKQTTGYALLGSGWMRGAVVRHVVRRVLPERSLVNTWLLWDKLMWHTKHSGEASASPTS